MMFFSFLFTCALSGNMKKRLLMPSRGKTLKLRSAYARRVIFSFICWLVCALWLMSLCAPSVLMSKCFWVTISTHGYAAHLPGFSHADKKSYNHTEDVKCCVWN